MNILIITQKVNKNDAILGFFHEWIREFSKHCGQVTVVCLEKGEYNLPENVRVFSLGKEGGVGRGVSRYMYVQNFFTYIVRERKNYDVVFVHMNPIYVILGGLVWKFLGKKVALWYTHKQVDTKLRLATRISDVVFSASRESFRLKTSKLKVFGHGIDTELFSPALSLQERSPVSDFDDKRLYKIVSVGRISETKNQLLMVQVVEELLSSGFHIQLEIVGSPISGTDKVYEKRLSEYCTAHKLGERVRCLGDISPAYIPETYRAADMFINLSNTGSLDKAVLEAMSCGLQIATSNEAFKNIVPAENFIPDVNKDEIVSKVRELVGKQPGPTLRDYVVKNHNLKVLISRLCQALDEIK